MLAKFVNIGGAENSAKTANHKGVFYCMSITKSPKQLMLLVCGGLLLAALVMALCYGLSGNPAAILVDGRQVAAVPSEAQANAVLEKYLQEQANAIGNEVFFKEDVTVSTEVTPGSETVSREEATELLVAATHLMTHGAAINVDGQPVVYMATAEGAANALEYLKKSYLPDDSTMTVLDAKFAEEVIVEPTEVQVADIKDLNEAKLFLKGEGQETAPVNVVVVLEKTKTEEIPFETVYETDTKLRYGQTETKQAGSNGSREVTIQLVQTNGVETARQEISSNTLVEAVDEIVLQGGVVKTAARSSTYITDAGMIWPTTATRISSYYGARGGGHTGLDIDGEYGDSVWAAKSGTVVSAGYNGSYGNEVVISHGDNLQTRYAHLQSISVSVGDEVEIGQEIGKEGSTGNSTGSHLHFEVLIDGSQVNPLPYIQ